MSIQDTVDKFLEGDVIVDRRNPFKEGGDSLEGLNIIVSGPAVHRSPPIADDTKGPAPAQTSSTHPKGNSRQTTNNHKSKPHQINKITKNQYNRKQHSHTKTKSLANCSNSLICINNEIQNENSKQFISASTPEGDEHTSFLEEYPSVGQLQDSSDAYASLIEILTMENKKTKRSSLKKIFPSIFSSNSKSSKNADKSASASPGAPSVPEGEPVPPGSPDQLKKAVADNANNGEDNRYYFEERASPKQPNFLKKDNNDNSQSSSTSTLVSDGDNARNNFKAKIPIRKSSLKNELGSISPAGGYNNHLTSDKHDTLKAQSSQKIDQIVPPVRTTSIPLAKPNNELVIVEPSTSIPTQKYETKVFRPIIVKSSYFHPELRDGNLKPSTFYYHNTKNMENNNRNEFSSLDSHEYSQPVSKVFADIISVGAEMKISTTNVTVSPKKESEVQLRKQLRARSLSPAECKIKNILQEKDTDGTDDSRNPTPVKSQLTVTPIDSCSNNDDSDNAIITEEQYAQTKKRNSELRSKSNPIIKKEIKIYRPVILNSVPDKLKYDSDSGNKLTNNVSNQPTKKSADSLVDLDYQKFNHNEMATSSPMKPNNGKTSSVEYRHTKSPDNVPPEQKIKNLHNVEAFYWQQLKKIKQQQEEELLRQTMSSNDMILNRYALQNNGRSSSSDFNLGPVGQVPWRCRSVSPGFVRTSEQRSNSLPHFNDNPFTKPPTGIKEFTNKLDGGLVPVPVPLERKNIVNPNFVRGSSTRYTIGTTNDITIRKNPGRQIAQNYGSYTTHRGAGAGDRNLLLPIFKKGSLSVEPMKESTLVREKRVSFSNSQGNDSLKLKSVYENLASSQMSGNLDPNLARPSRNQLQMFQVARPLEQTSSLPRGQYNVQPSVMHTYGKITKNRQSEGVYATIQNRGYDRNVPRRIQNLAYPGPASPPLESKDCKMNSAAGVAKNLFFRRVSSARAGQHLASVGQSESESGSEAGEVQRIMLGGKMSPGRTVFQPYQGKYFQFSYI